MFLKSFQTGKRGISLTEVLIGIIVLGIGVISLATLFPLGLLRMRRSVNETRGAYLGRSALAETRIRNLLAPPYGPLANAFRADPLLSTGEPEAGTTPAIMPLSGPGIPIVIDPLFVMNNPVISGYTDYPTFDRTTLASPTRNEKRLGYSYNLASSSVLNYGLPRYRGNIAALELAQQIFSAHDDLAYSSENRSLLIQTGTGLSPQYLTPTQGLPFVPGTVFREPKYSWFLIARKVDAGQVSLAALDGKNNDPDYDQNGDNVIDTRDLIDPILLADSDEFNNPGPDGYYGGVAPSVPVAMRDKNGNGIHDTAEDDTPVGPFAVSIAIFYQRDFINGEKVFPFVYPFGPDGAPGRAGTDDDGNGITDFDAELNPDWGEFLAPNSDDAPTNVLRIPILVPGVPPPPSIPDPPFSPSKAPPDIPKGGFILDATYDLNSSNVRGPRHSYWYRVDKKETVFDAGLGVNVLQLTLEGDVKAFMQWTRTSAPYVPSGIGTGVFMKGVIGVYEKVVP